MIATCEHCEATVSMGPLSAPMPKCDCGCQLCWACYDDSTNCFKCNRLIHSKCAVAVGEDDYCEACGARALMQRMLDELAELSVAELQRVCLLAKNEFLKVATLEELMAASKVIAEMRKAA